MPSTRRVPEKRVVSTKADHGRRPERIDDKDSVMASPELTSILKEMTKEHGKLQEAFIKDKTRAEWRTYAFKSFDNLGTILERGRFSFGGEYYRGVTKYHNELLILRERSVERQDRQITMLIDRCVEAGIKYTYQFRLDRMAKDFESAKPTLEKLDITKLMQKALNDANHPGTCYTKKETPVNQLQDLIGIAIQLCKLQNNYEDVPLQHMLHDVERLTGHPLMPKHSNQEGVKARTHQQETYEDDSHKNNASGDVSETDDETSQRNSDCTAY